jgi:hypothetical protein
MKVMIWSNEHGMWWRPDQQGFTPHSAEAGLYDEDDARDIVSDATLGGDLFSEHVNPMTGQRYQEFSDVVFPCPTILDEVARLKALLSAAGIDEN